jgi:hypothetical protein
MMMNLKGFGRSGRDLILKYYAGIRLEGLRKTAKTSIRSPGLRIEPGTSRIRSRNVNHSTTTFGETHSGDASRRHGDTTSVLLGAVIMKGYAALAIVRGNFVTERAGKKP